MIPASKIRALLPRFSCCVISFARPRPTAVVYFPRMAAKKTTLNELGEMLAFVVKRMATKDDIADLRREMATKDDITRLDTKLTKFEEHEIDKRLRLEVRASAIEKHLGLDNCYRRCKSALFWRQIGEGPPGRYAMRRRSGLIPVRAFR